MNLAQKFNELKKSGLFEYLDFMKSGYVYSEKIKDEISIQYNDISIPGLDNEVLILSQIKSEINTIIYNKIIKDLFDTELYSLLDYRNSDIEHRFLNEITNIFSELTGYKNIICSSYLGSLFRDVYSFSSVKNYSRIDNYKIGNLFGLDIWIDPYMKHNDTRIVGFNDVYIEFDNSIHSIDGYLSSSKLSINFDYSYNKGLSKILYLLSDDSDPIVFSEYKKIERNIKINKILDNE